MYMIDRYELTIPGHMRLVDARSALNHLERLVQSTEEPLGRDQLVDSLTPLVDALNDAADDVRAINGHDAFMRQACEWNYIALSPSEREMLHQIRCCNDDGKKDICKMVSETMNRKPMPEPK